MRRFTLQDVPAGVGKLLKRLFQAYIVLITGLFVAYAVYVISAHHIVTTTHDQWRIFNGYFRRDFFDAVLALQNGHRPIFPGVLFFVDLYVFGGNNHFLVYTGLAFNVLFAGLFVFALSREQRLPLMQRLLAGSYIVMGCFWLGNSRMQCCGNESPKVYLVLLALSISVIALSGYTKDREELTPVKRVGLLTIVLAAAVVSTFSFGSGILIWPILIFLALVLGAGRSSALALGVGFGLSLLAYFLLPGSSVVSGTLRLDVPAVIIATGTIVGSPVFHISRPVLGPEMLYLVRLASPIIGLLAAVGSCILLFYMLLKRLRVSRFEAICMALIMFCLGTGVLVGLTRGAGLSSYRYALADRYVVWSTAFWLGFLPLLLIRSNALSGKRLLASAPLLVIFLMVPYLLYPSHRARAGHMVYGKFRMAEAGLSLVVGAPDKEYIDRYLRRPLPEVYQVSQHFKANRMNMFSEGLHTLIGEKLSARYSLTEDARCVGEVLETERFSSQYGEGVRVDGYALYTGEDRKISLVLFADADGVINGLGKFTRVAPHAAMSMGLAPDERIGFLGYLKPNSSDGRFEVYGVIPGKKVCKVSSAELRRSVDASSRVKAGE